MSENTSTNNVKKAKLDGKPKMDSFHNKDGLLLKTYAWVVKDPVGIIILVHGMNSRVKLEYLRHNVEIIDNKKAIIKDADDFFIYENSWIEQFNKNNFSVYGLDLQGHGLSDGWKNSRSHLNKFDDLAYDVIQYINRIHDLLCLSYKTDNNLSLHDNIINTKIPPFYIIGQSMGGNIVLRILEILGKSKDNNKKVYIKGCIPLAGMISIDHLLQKPSFKYFYAPMSKIFATIIPNFRLATPQMKFRKFPYINDITDFDKSKKPITSKFARELLNAIDNLNNDIEYIPKDVHILFFHSKCDSLCFYQGAYDFYNKIDSPNKEFFTLEDMDHCLSMEPGNENIIKKILEWISKLPNDKDNN